MKQRKTLKQLPHDRGCLACRPGSLSTLEQLGSFASAASAATYLGAAVASRGDAQRRVESRRLTSESTVIVTCIDSLMSKPGKRQRLCGTFALPPHALRKHREQAVAAPLCRAGAPLQAKRLSGQTRLASIQGCRSNTVGVGTLPMVKSPPCSLSAGCSIISSMSLNRAEFLY